jgi:hypothetical protein
VRDIVHPVGLDLILPALLLAGACAKPRRPSGQTLTLRPSPHVRAVLSSLVHASFDHTLGQAHRRLPGPHASDEPRTWDLDMRPSRSRSRSRSRERGSRYARTEPRRRSPPPPARDARDWQHERQQERRPERRRSPERGSRHDTGRSDRERGPPSFPQPPPRPPLSDEPPALNR